MLLSSSGPGPGPSPISNVKAQKRTRADAKIQMHHPPPYFSTSIYRSKVHLQSESQRYLKVTFKYDLDSEESPSCLDLQSFW